MQIQIKNLLRGVIIFLLVISFSACHNLFNNEEEEPETTYLVGYEMVRSYLPVMVETMFDQMVKLYPEMAVVQERVKHGIIIYKISYKTTFNGESKLASGLVCVPTGEGSFPIMSYQNGTNTLHSNAPSVNPNYELYLLLEAVASTGFVVSLPDYLGFGASDNMFHPYLHKESTVQTVVDMLRAVDELADIRNFSLNKDLYLAGYSQGGWATLQVQKAIEENYSGEFNLKASAPGAGPYDLNFVNQYILGQSTYPMPYFVGYMFDSYSHFEEMTTPIEEIFNEPYAAKIPTLYDGTKSGVEINAELSTNISELFTENYRTNFNTDESYSSLITMLEANSIEAWNTSVPTKIIHGTADTFVPAQVSNSIQQDFVSKGAQNVEFIPIPNVDHIDGIVPAGLYSIGWFLELTE
ncbi:Pimeloyl-ACP methyl ester carboxylesterase [Mariniphaga anaerophila]|uniref:Pimeloyl-ACP methyl ester carboxylesterase n=1 Tax=Mariniphaga anaerophila TaxID=1484053 RepID=A0A1M4VHX0_9BACT|nr:lipase family protein [Mariniphaga anaerophila]SHE68601.1 Pimeloyl-ACP methyl ester carboxylesterase [Mariniphaga anaerophila]